MRGLQNSLDEILSPFLSHFQQERFARQEVNERPPLRSELFSIEQMEGHAQQLAKTHQLSTQDAPELLLKRLAENEHTLFEVANLLHEAVREKKGVTPAGEWLLDNFYLIEEQVNIGKKYLPKGYSKGLPRLATGSAEGYPRVYDIAIQIISHSDGRVDLNILTSFINAYQKVNYLTIGELWAVPIMLRLALLENLSRVAARIAVDRKDTDLADQWGDKVVKTAEESSKDLVLVIADMARSNPPMVSAFVAEFTRKLQWKGLDFNLPLTWIEQHLAESSTSINQMVLVENTKQAADQLSVSNSINSLRFLAKTDWREFVEELSIVERLLKEDPAGVYAKMDFHTRDQYRHAIEKIAKQSKTPENKVAEIAIHASRDAGENIRTEALGRQTHVGYWLIGPGCKETARRTGSKLKFNEAIHQFFRQRVGGIYAFLLVLVSAALAFGLAYHTWKLHGLTWPTILVGLLSTIAASHFAIAIVNWWATLFVKPRPLPKLDFSKGIPEEHKTLVAVPTMLASRDQAQELADDLEVRFLANRDPNLFFVLLTDLKDADVETLPEDAEIINTARVAIARLNHKYPRPGSDRFFLLHRPRHWNITERKWMGYERKRGKLSDLNRLLLGQDLDRFSVISGSVGVLQGIRYVITLDTDTQLPHDSAAQMVGLMAHPLNRPAYDERRRVITDGYGIIQPRIALSLHGATFSRYTRMHENDSGIDPYTRITSDVYQDVFAEGSFIGKGIYDVQAFERVLGGRFPENRILSHDLLEGSYARCGYASDIQLYEAYPSKYSSDVARRHRWIRGDWQIGNWSLPWAVAADKRLHKNPISFLSRWKIFDNLRRSLVPIALLALIILAWTVLREPLFWTLCITAIIMLPPFLMSIWHALNKPPELDRTQHLRNSLGGASKGIQQSAFSLICLPYEAFYSADAIIRTLWRVYVSHRHLLEWNPSGFLKNEKSGPLPSYTQMWFSPFLTIVTAGYLMLFRPEAILMAAPILIAWFSSPLVIWWLSKPLPSTRSQIDAAQHRYLRTLARKTWAFFVDLVGPTDNWLPPDNLQQYPIPVVAHRTSPTNIGLSLLANLTAYDFGYISTESVIERTENTLATLEKLERYQGHFFNWYDTQSLQTLYPRYISSVDSGNLAGHLLTMRQGLIELVHRPLIPHNIIDGLYDTLLVAAESSRSKNSTLQKLVTSFEQRKPAAPTRLEDVHEFLSGLKVDFLNITQESPTEEMNTDTRYWLGLFTDQLNAMLVSVEAITPWLSLPGNGRPDGTQSLHRMPTLWDLSQIDKEHPGALNDENSQFEKVQDTSATYQAGQNARNLVTKLNRLADKCFEFADMEYGFLYDKSQRLLAIGFNVDTHQRDSSYYDLLASEARLANFVAIAQNKVPQESWFALGRRLTTSDKTPVLLSWSGSMFEYLMPLLVMPTYERTLLDETYKGTVKRQIEYAKHLGIPWGISESCYNIVDSSLIYQYRAFGVPGLGFKRGLGLDLVIAPYATVLALMVDPKAATQNLLKLKSSGFEGKYGFFEAVDFTPSRLPRGQSQVLIQTFMAHHQGMSLLSLSYLLLDQPMQRRFESDVQFQTSLLLLQEQVPKTVGHYTASTEMEDITPVSSHAMIRVIQTPSTPTPEVQLLSNGRYHAMLTNSGAGYSRWRELAVTRWREDGTSDTSGTFCYIRDLEKQALWSNTFQPTLAEPEHYSAIFSQGRVEFRRSEHQFETYTEIIVSPEDDIEIRRVHLTNRSRTKRHIEFTSYAEAVLAPHMADALHPAFSNLFVQTEIVSGQHAIMCTRRPRSKDETPPWMFHAAKLISMNNPSVSFETDRYRFIGRGNSLTNPRATQVNEPLSGTQGPVLDPIVSVQYRIIIEPEETVILDLITGSAVTRDDCQHLVDKYQDRHLRDRAFELSWTHSQVVLRQINANEEEAELYARLAGSVIYANPALRASPSVLMKNQRGQSALWSYSISGDLPIVLLEVSESSNISLVKQLIQAQAYWHLKGLAVDLVILNQDASGYRQVLQDQIQSLIAAGFGMNTQDKQGRIFVRPVDQVSAEDVILLKAVARVVLSDSRGTLADQINRRAAGKQSAPYLNPLQHYTPVKISLPQQALKFFNGLGGFSDDGREYVIQYNGSERTPLPWINVIANSNIGCIATESGLSYTWCENAHAYRLTPWNNDPVTDKSGEALYIRDEESGEYWSATPLPCRKQIPFVTRHGFGYTTYEHAYDGLIISVTLFVDLEAPVRFLSVRIQNHSGRARSLSVTQYLEWVLADLRSRSALHIMTELDTSTGALLARNAYNLEFPNRTAFIDVDDPQYEYTSDRGEFLGINGTLEHPEAMRKARLSGKSGAGFDPCTALRVAIELEAGGSREVVFRLGAGKDRFEATQLIKNFRGARAAQHALERVKQFWTTSLGAVQISTPEPSLDILTNGWLQYQVMACRLWGRSGYYQSGGAFGFRDQLQDVLALLHSQPTLARNQILLAASRQFLEGDVQHWWHPPIGRGVRTMCSDDFIWLPYVTASYVTTTGDYAILNETVAFLEGRPLNSMEESYYDLPVISEKRASVYEHCKRAIQHGLRFGDHGLPLIGSGDWNDGMNMVGIHGRGESVWLAFFLYDVLVRFQSLAKSCNDETFASLCDSSAAELKRNIDMHAWDGDWYRRAYFDDGTPLGSSTNDECRIDSISQSWSIISDGGDPQRSRQAMRAVNKHLVNRDKGLLQLLDPPFDKSALDPGYIKGYVPGVRENGGQYTHAAVWMIMAFAKLGDASRTWELLSLINPINHGRKLSEINTYKVEPYVMAADVYGVYPHTGRGGWTWYTGSAGWMYQLIVSSVLGIRREGDKLWLAPVTPQSWKEFSINYQWRTSAYRIHAIQEEARSTVTVRLDGNDQAEPYITLLDDGRVHEVEIFYQLPKEQDQPALTTS
ncbi:MAG: glucoamylase family protein [Chryseolinea sp.]